MAVSLIPVLISVGASLDTIRTYNARTKIQADLDAALIAAVRDIKSGDAAAIRKKVAEWFAAQQTMRDGSYALDDVVVNIDGQTITADASGSVPTTLLSLANISAMPLSVRSSVLGPSDTYMNVYFVLDKSPSMLLAATTAGQARMQSQLNCVFACHTAENGSNNYLRSRKLGVSLRTDVALDAVRQALNMIDEADPGHDRIKVGLYTIGDMATEVLAPTFSTATARNSLTNDGSGLTSATSSVHSYFDVSLAQLTQFVGTAGDGSTPAKPQKLVLLLTDGVQSQREWVTDDVRFSGGRAYGGTSWYKVAPLNPAWCANMKRNGATVGALYTEYLPITVDWGYNATVGSTMALAKWKATWGGVMRSGMSSAMTRQAYIPYALADCASSSDLFISAASSSEIEKGLKTILRNYMTALRIVK